MSARTLVAYVIVSLVWGSTYLAIRIGVRHVPPALFGGVRFTTAGLILLVASVLSGRRVPRRWRDWGRSAVVGVLLLAVGNGGVIWAEQSVESGTAAVLVVTGALWMALFDALIPGSEAKPTWQQFSALTVGFGGSVLLVTAGGAPLGAAGAWGPLVLVGSAASWALGSIYAKRRPVDASPYVNASLQMIAGGLVLLTIGVLTGEAADVQISPPGLAAVGYLIVFGSIVAYTNYVYLLRHAQPAFVGTTNYVNTVVAVTLGWLWLNEHVTRWTFVAIAVVLGSVVWVRQARRRQPGPPVGRPAVSGPVEVE